jgi:hypothetical protein
MGADGHIICVKRADWDASCPDVKPEEISLYTGTILGVEAVWGYAGDNLIGCGCHGWNNYGDDFYINYDSAQPDQKASKVTVAKRRTALAWFDEHAEWHEVWT